MQPDNLTPRYRNLLIAIARELVELKAHVAVLQDAAGQETSYGRRCGLLAKANSHLGHVHWLDFALRKNRVSLRQLFGTTDAAEISRQEITLLR